jgi:hypothetical protein
MKGKHNKLAKMQLLEKVVIIKNPVQPLSFGQPTLFLYKMPEKLFYNQYTYQISIKY